MRLRAYHVRCGLAAMLLALAPSIAASQTAPSPTAGGDSVVIAAGARYQAGGLRRWLMGNGRRDVWNTPVRVPLLNLRTFAGGLRPLKVGGGHQTKSLRFVTPDGVEYAFRCVDKDKVNVPPRFKGTVLEWAARDQVGASFPAGALVAAPLLEAARVLHVTPVLFVMPDDTLLGAFRAEFAGRLGLIEEHPKTLKHHRAGFAGAAEIIDSDSLLHLLNGDPLQRVDAPALLAARLMDMLFNDWDRHPGQWKWARLAASSEATWVPIPSDQDWSFGSVDGLLPGLARVGGFAKLLTFDDSYSIRGLTWNSLEFDRRLLGGMEKPVWDSVAAALVRRVTDPVIDAAVQTLPPEYRSSAPQLARTLKRRRDGLPAAASRFYRTLAAVADIHATDAADRATITRVNDRVVEVRLESGNGTPYFLRRFDGRETSEIRVYLHGGDDSALVTGHGQLSIPVRIIGGNGTNRLSDSSRVGHRARLYDAGHVEGVGYGPDTSFDRRPWVKQNGQLVPPGRDRGDGVMPILGLGSNRDLGLVPNLGMRKYSYGFRHRPYASAVGLQAEYASKTGGFRIALTGDQRRESSPVHFLVTARMSQLEILNFYGFGNDTPWDSTTSYAARQRQWLLQPAVARALGRRSDLSFGPVVQYSVTDSAPGRFLSASRPYGFGHFGEAGLRLGLHHDTRDVPRDPGRGLLMDVSGTFFPALWDVSSTFGAIAAGATAFLTVPVPMHPVLVLRGGGKKVYGDFPFHEAAFIGGRSTLRSLDPQRYAGDAAVYGSAELRLRVARFAFILPVDAVIFGIVDAGRVLCEWGLTRRVAHRSGRWRLDRRSGPVHRRQGVPATGRERTVLIQE
jgi:hypothetical protein